ncbi:MAG: hypothetical protein HOV77_20925 [Hamadaea sp.]|uniref:hypothetical protein n=1 Tax=Hamadaea sp. TaxID=2024425 RepID=UPI00182DC3FC|nr:hypothetical protein [Hamadaea sp.]NUT21648.1 hypothetical protein [Hamadaea sp.]
MAAEAVVFASEAAFFAAGAAFFPAAFAGAAFDAGMAGAAFDAGMAGAAFDAGFAGAFDGTALADRADDAFARAGAGFGVGAFRDGAAFFAAAAVDGLRADRATVVLSAAPAVAFAVALRPAGSAMGYPHMQNGRAAGAAHSE